MRNINDLPAWERMFKKMVWAQLGDINGLKVLDFGSGEGITANYLAENNEVTAVEPWDEMLKNRWDDNNYRQIHGDVSALKEFNDNTFDFIIIHNVLEYIDDKKEVLTELTRVLKKGGTISLVKHNRNGRIMQAAVLLDDFEMADSLLNNEDGRTTKYGQIKYYNDSDITEWVPQLAIEKVYGMRTFWDLQQNQDKHSDNEWQDKMLTLEMKVSKMSAFKDIAFFHHIYLRKH